MIPRKIKTDDLLGKPWKMNARGPDAYDCYGLVIECCKRAGTPLLDLKYCKEMNQKGCEELGKISGVNLKKIASAKAGCLVEIDLYDTMHIGYMLDNYNVLHTTKSGVKCTNIKRLCPIGFLEVTE